MAPIQTEVKRNAFTCSDLIWSQRDKDRTKACVGVKSLFSTLRTFLLTTEKIQLVKV